MLICKSFSFVLVLFVAAAAGLKSHNLFLAVEDFIMCPRNNVSVTGLVLARGGSKGIPLKNLATVSGKSLLRRAIEKMIESKSIIFVLFLNGSRV